MKHTIRLNIALVTSLGRVMGMTNIELMKATGIMNATWYRIMEHPDQITVQQLISLANGLHIPVRRFFLHDDTDMVGIKKYYVENQYTPCYYDTKSLLHLIDTQAVATWQDVANTLNISRSNLRNSLLLDSRLPLGRFLSACEVFGIDPFCVIIDPNPIAISFKRVEQMDAIDTKQYYATIQYDLAIMHNDLATFRAEIMNLRREITRMDKKLDLIIDAYFEEIKDPEGTKPNASLTKQETKEIGDAKQIAALANQAAKEAQSHAEEKQKLLDNKIVNE